MTTSFSMSQIEQFRREAKLLSRELAVTHSMALDRIASRYGFKNWSLFIKNNNPVREAAKAGKSQSASTSARYRHYLHGDEIEGNPDSYYCARCDLRVGAEHFFPKSWHDDNEDGERFLDSLARWNALANESKGNRYRPADAPNALQASAEVARLAHETSRSAFHRWLSSQRGRNDPVGDLAGDACSDKRFPWRSSSYRELKAYLAPYGTDVTDALKEAWLEYKASEKIAKNR